MKLRVKHYLINIAVVVMLDIIAVVIFSMESIGAVNALILAFIGVWINEEEEE